MSLFDTEVQIPERRVEVLANILAAFRWPGQGGATKIKKAQREASERIAREALQALAREPD